MVAWVYVSIERLFVSTNRELVLDYLAQHGPARPSVIYRSTGIKTNSGNRLLREMKKAGQIVKVRDTGLYGLTTQSFTQPNPVGKSPLPKTNVRRDKSIPTWNPGVEYDNNGGELRTPPQIVSGAAVDATPDEASIFSHFEMDSSEWKITNLRRSKWQSATGQWLEAYRASFVKRSGANLAAFTEDELTELLTPYQVTEELLEISDDGTERIIERLRTRSKKFDGSVHLVAIGDTQFGKPDGGGTQGTIERFQRIMADVRDDLQQRGGVQALVLPWLGDCLEGLVSQGGRNVARLDISITEQVRVYRRLFLHQVAILSPWAEQVLIPVVGGNHDEAFRDQVQSPNDSWAIEGASAVADALALAEQFEHVKFLFPEPERWGVTVNVASEESPYIIHFEHGHKARASNKMIDWWKGQTHGRQPAGAADMLITAHWHNFQINSTGGDRWWFQLPAMDGGSDWYRDKTGEDSTAGVLAMDIVGGQAGWSDLKLYH